MEIRIKYDSSQVSEPKSLSVKRISSDGKEDILKIKEIDTINNELVFETEHFSKFIIKDDIPLYRFYNSSLKTWSNKGIENQIATIQGIEVKKFTPYHYLVESLDFYYKSNNIKLVPLKPTNQENYKAKGLAR
jgi:hypothetical protein